VTAGYAVDLQIVSNIVAIAVGLVVGSRLLQKGIREQAAPEILLGLCLFFDGIEWFFWALALYTPAAGTPLGDAFAIGCRIGIQVSLICLLLFTRVVFRPDSRWAGTVSAVLIVLLLGSLLGSGMAHDWKGWRSDLPWVWIEFAALDAIYVWTVAESLSYYLKMRRRVAHDLADPVVANSFALWATYAGSVLLANIVSSVALLMDDELGRYPAALDLAMVALTLVASAGVWLAFFPPRRYLVWARGTSLSTPR